MTDIRIVEYSGLEGCTMDWLFRDTGFLDDREELATAVRVALGTDAIADTNEILPDPDSTDRRGWWGDMDAEEIWDGWPIGTRSWLLTRAKITSAMSYEGSTLERAKQYTRAALQPLINKGIASRVDVIANQIDTQRIDVQAMVYRGPLDEISLRYQMLWEEGPAFDTPKTTTVINKLIRIPYRDLKISSVAPTVIRSLGYMIIPQGNLIKSTTAPIRSP